MKIVVAGGDGFIGWPLSLALSQAGHEVLVLTAIATRHKGRVNADVIRPMSFWRRSQAA